MRDTIKIVMDAEKKASEIVSAAQTRASELVARHNSEITGKLNTYRTDELERYNSAVSKAELEYQTAIEDIRNTEVEINADLARISEEIRKRVFKTVFDK